MFRLPTSRGLGDEALDNAVARRQALAGNDLDRPSS